MVGPITSIAPAVASGAVAPGGGASQPGGFQQVLEGAIHDVEQFRNVASQAVDKLLSGEGAELHSVALATQKAELAFDLGLQIRNKVVQAYQEVMRMQM